MNIEYFIDIINKSKNKIKVSSNSPPLVVPGPSAHHNMMNSLKLHMSMNFKIRHDFKILNTSFSMHLLLVLFFSFLGLFRE